MHLLHFSLPFQKIYDHLLFRICQETQMSPISQDIGRTISDYSFCSRYDAICRANIFFRPVSNFYIDIAAPQIEALYFALIIHQYGSEIKNHCCLQFSLSF